MKILRGYTYTHVPGLLLNIVFSRSFLMNAQPMTFFKIQFYVPFKIISAHMRQANQ